MNITPLNESAKWNDATTWKPFMIKILYKVFVCFVAILIPGLSDASEVGNRLINRLSERADTALISQLKANAQRHYSAGALDSALMDYTRITRMDAQGDSLISTLRSEAYNNSAVIWFSLGNYPRAYNAFLMAADAGNDAQKVGVYNNIASIYHFFNDQDRALGYLEKAFDGAITTKNWDALLSATLNITNFRIQTNTLDVLSLWVNRFKDAPVPDSPLKQYVVSTADGGVALGKGDTKGALRAFRRADSIISVTPALAHYIGAAGSNVAQTLMKDGQIDAAERCLNQLIDNSFVAGNTETEMWIMQKLSECAKLKGNKEKELDYKLQYVNLKDSLFSAKEFGKVLDFQSSYELDTMEQRLAESDFQRRNRETVIIYSLLLVLVAVISAIWLVIQNRKLRENIRLLYEKAKQEEISKVGTDSEEAILAPEQAYELSSRISGIMRDDKPWKNPDFSLSELARLAHSNTKYVSYVLNNIIGKSFTTLVNEYRVAEVCRCLADEENYGKMTIEAIGTEVGFKSRSNFGTTFKKITGLTPKTFLAMSREEHKKNDLGSV